MALSWEERALRVRGGDADLAAAPVDIDGATYRAMFEAIFRHTADSVVLCHTTTGVYYEVSDLYCDLTGYSRSELLGQTSVTLRLVDPEGVRLRVEMDGVARLHGLYENRLTRKDGTRRWVEFSHQEVGPDLTLVIIRDITAVKEMEESLREMASMDALTHVLNSTNFRERAETMLVQWPDALLVVADLDGLKIINDTWGHAVGDEAIVAIANELVAAVGQGGLVGRLGGDEFAALLTGSTEDPAFTLRRVRNALAGIRLETIDATVSASIGVASGKLAYAALEQAADAAMYEGKRFRPHGR
ncbi:sensor domain-containing diguanylate cyclase [Nocardioides baekrokdamisoli]|uniref:sensor domain-containing diguanylate cyclase n=1 Tax=Nocardioides baekrokdamisoli TaxID=1804624 RepID=UPI0013DE4F35|nr:diguanylate cyclase [Nocardioides baekrokdamisoli]